ncbi:DUF2157 domain-containing protein [Nocardioides jishulii]|uniref:DUF2157 domain-containing protein n=1 Tax=Nocardioides jishulii TaxID=2575440 RepID=A0A4U2YSY6_9ACTN|nr:DUF2157 domain-containing protein [Nocardioides jishulii]QCX28461.1 DUF2157 domain-containing protein [Nocardioides jishulii]TKI64646.1 DUF2157 domain-containing protein [Nocardioides jishulii]
MTTTVPTPPPPAPPTEAVSGRHLEWLRTEVSEWRADGLLTDAQAASILGRYHESRVFSLTRLLLALGAVFVGVGVIWLVAANIDALPPLVRFVGVTALWLALLVGAEALSSRGSRRLLVGALRIMAAFAIGGVVFQAAQSLQVPAYEATLVGVWGAAALLQAYAFRAVGPLVVGVAGFVGWSLWQGLTPDPSFADVVFVVVLTGLVALGLAALDDTHHRAFAAVWRATGAALLLAGLFISALPVDDDFTLSGQWWNLTLVGLAVVALAAGALRGRERTSHVELAGGVVTLLLALLLAAWSAGASVEEMTLATWAHTAVAVVGYVALAVGVAVLGTLRDSRTLTSISTLALVIFTTSQSFTVFAAVIEGAWLFLFLGLVLLGTGWAFDRGRRRLAAAIETDTTPTPTDGAAR